MKPINTLAKGAVIAFIGLFLSKILGYIYRLVIARTGAEDYGLISIALGIISISVLFPIFGLDSGVLRYVAYFKGKRENRNAYNVLRISLLISFVFSWIVSGLLFLLSDDISILIFHNPKLTLVLRLFSLTIPFYALDRIGLAALRSINKVQYEVYSKVLFHNITKIILTLLFVYLGFGLFGLSFAFLISVIGMGLLSFYFLYKKFPRLYQNSLSLKDFRAIPLLREIYHYSWPLLFFSYCYVIFSWTDTLMIGHFLNASQAGIYNVALPTAAFLVVVPVALRNLFMPIITASYAKKEYKQIRPVYDSVVRWTFLVNLPVLLFTLLFSKQIITILFGAEYTSGFLCLLILSIGYFSLSLLDVSMSVLNMIKKSILNFYNGIAMIILNVILNALLIPRYGIVGGALATTISLITLGVLCAIEGWYYTKLLPIQVYFVKLIILSTTSVVFIWGVNQIISLVDFVDLLFFAFYFVGFYIALILFTRSLKIEDLDLIKSVFVKLKSIGKPINHKE